ncbi:MAG TPA: hypothetical protein VLF94_07120 [Chlamydiales bacterium]|nr:hypothetical protein [Chlamydiales bacterium]
MALPAGLVSLDPKRLMLGFHTGRCSKCHADEGLFLGEHVRFKDEVLREIYGKSFDHIAAFAILVRSPGWFAQKFYAVQERGAAQEEEAILGYYTTEGYWIEAPNREGKVFQERVLHLIREHMWHLWGNLQIPTEGALFHEYVCGNPRQIKDSNGRRFGFVRANGGYVPVRHGTDPDPRMTNWISTKSRVKTVYDETRTRHPAIEGIDYARHGFRLHGNSWWPINNGEAFIQTHKRVTLPCDEEYDRGTPEKRIDWEALAGAIAGTALVLTGIGFAIPAYAGFLSANAILGDRLPSILAGAHQGGMAAQQMVPREKEPPKDKFTVQYETMHLLDFQDSVNLGDEIVQAMMRRDQAAVGRLLQENPEILFIEHRGSLAIYACILNAETALRALLDNKIIEKEERGQALVIAVENGNRPNVERLLAGNPPIDFGLSDKALIAAAKRGDPWILGRLLEFQHNPVELGNAVIEAVKQGSSENVNALLRTGSLSKDQRSQALLEAIRLDREPIAITLIGDGPIRDQERGEALVAAVGKEHMELVHVLLGGGSVIREYREQAAVLAAQHGKDDLLRAIRENGQISEPSLRQIDEAHLLRRRHRQQMQEAGPAV